MALLQALSEASRNPFLGETASVGRRPTAFRYQDLLSYVTPDVALARTPYERSVNSIAAIPQPNPVVCTAAMLPPLHSASSYTKPLIQAFSQSLCTMEGVTTSFSGLQSEGTSFSPNLLMCFGT